MTDESVDSRSAAWSDSLVAPIPSVPEDWTVFRLARVILLLEVAHHAGRRVQTIDRLGYYEFFADSPFIVVDGHSARDEDDRLTLELVGFMPAQLAYASSGQRFVSRRRRLQHDLGRLFAYGLVELDSDGYRLTNVGTDLASQLNSVYADAYRTSAEVVLRRLSALSNKGLEEKVNRWFGESWLLIDLLDDVADAVAPPHSVEHSAGLPGHGPGEAAEIRRANAAEEPPPGVENGDNK